MQSTPLDTIDRPDAARFAPFGRRPGADRHPGEDRRDRRRRVIRVRRSLASASYENDLKLSIALDRLLRVLECA